MFCLPERKEDWPKVDRSRRWSCLRDQTRSDHFSVRYKFRSFFPNLINDVHDEQYPLTAMDFVLEICDEHAFDKIYAYLLPASAFARLASPKAVLNASTPLVGNLPTSKWTEFISFLPHPPLPADITSSSSFASSPTNAVVSAWPRDYVPRQLISLAFLTLVGIHVLYFLFAGLSYRYIFDHKMMCHPRFLKDQIKLEIQSSLRAFPGMTALTLPWFQAEVMGYSKLYVDVEEHGWAYFFFSIPL